MIEEFKELIAKGNAFDLADGEIRDSLRSR
jgi:hypothetical protein